MHPLFAKRSFASMAIRTACGKPRAFVVICRWSKHLEPKRRMGRGGLLSDALVASVDAYMCNKTVMSATEVKVSRELAHYMIRRLDFTHKRTRKEVHTQKEVHGPKRVPIQACYLI